jgi:hypothetical protein
LSIGKKNREALEMNAAAERMPQPTVTIRQP